MTFADLFHLDVAHCSTVFMLIYYLCIAFLFLLADRVPMQFFASNVESGYRILDRTGEDVTDASIKK